MRVLVYTKWWYKSKTFIKQYYAYSGFLHANRLKHFKIIAEHDFLLHDQIFGINTGTAVILLFVSY